MVKYSICCSQESANHRSHRNSSASIDKDQPELSTIERLIDTIFIC